MLELLRALLFAGCLWIGNADYDPCPPGPKPPPDWLFYNVNRFQPLIDRWEPDWPDLPHAVVKAVIAQESQGINWLTSTDGHNSVGVMQIIPRSWTGSATQLMEPSFNIFVGMWILSSALDSADGDMLMALALYNCGEKAWEFDKVKNPYVCSSKGGHFYALRVLTYYCPLFLAEGEDVTEECGDQNIWMDYLKQPNTRYDLPVARGPEWTRWMTDQIIAIASQYRLK